MDRLTCNLRNVKRPIRGLFIGKTIVRDELGVEIPLRIYSRIKRDCNVFAVIDGKEYIIPTEEEFKKLLVKANNVVPKDQIKQVVPTEPHVYSTENNVALPFLVKENEDGVLVNTGIPVEESDNVITTASVDVEIPEETVEEEVPETVEEENNVEESTEEVEETDVKPQQYNNKNNRKNKNRR